MKWVEGVIVWTWGARILALNSCPYMQEGRRTHSVAGAGDGVERSMVIVDSPECTLETKPVTVLAMVLAIPSKPAQL